MPQSIPDLLSDVLAFLEKVEDLEPWPMGSKSVAPDLSQEGHFLAQRLRAQGVEPTRAATDVRQTALPLEVSVDDAEDALEHAMEDL